MWGSTEMVANALVEGLMSEGVKVQLFRLSNTNKTRIITNILDARAMLIGSPTLNNGLFPTVASFLTYMKGFKPRNKLGAFFGSYGWGGGARRKVEQELKDIGVELIESELDFKYKPNREELSKAVEFGKIFARKVLAK